MTEIKDKSFPCVSCGAFLVFKPGSNHLNCEYCGAENEIAASTEAIEELDFEKHLEETISTTEQIEVRTVKCNSCGAESTLHPSIVSDSCAFCGTALIVNDAKINTILKPKSLLPFKIESKEGLKLFHTWLSDLWFAPKKLREIGKGQKLDGMYIPYWTYDSVAYTHYVGQRGDNYVVEREVENNEGEKEVVQEIHTNWFPVAGIVQNDFDDILVLASDSLPKDIITKLEPWDLNELIPYNESYISGFRTETYKTDLKSGFQIAKKIMEPDIMSAIRHDIGGDQQTIMTSSSSYTQTTFKHILLPLWISAYKYNAKTYRFLINARTGEVQGERPYSTSKITGTIISAITVVLIFLSLGILYGLGALILFLVLLFKVFK